MLSAGRATRMAIDVFRRRPQTERGAWQAILIAIQLVYLDALRLESDDGSSGSGDDDTLGDSDGDEAVPGKRVDIDCIATIARRLHVMLTMREAALTLRQAT